jgi:PTS system N-acetylglucosamine-specific IIA component
MLQVLSPLAGHSVAVSDIPDPVFAKGLVGPGVAVLPRPGRQTSASPIAGTLVKLLPHAFVVLDDAEHAVLVHLGIDTVHMEGDGFTLLNEEGERVEAGDEVVAWDPAYVEQSGRSSACAVVVLDCDPADVVRQPVDVDVEQGDLLLEVDC